MAVSKTFHSFRWAFHKRKKVREEVWLGVRQQHPVSSGYDKLGSQKEGIYSTQFPDHVKDEQTPQGDYEKRKENDDRGPWRKYPKEGKLHHSLGTSTELQTMKRNRKSNSSQEELFFEKSKFNSRRLLQPFYVRVSEMSEQDFTVFTTSCLTSSRYPHSSEFGLVLGSSNTAR